MSTATTAPENTLADRIVQAKEDLRAAEAAVGAAVLDGGDANKAGARVQAARQTLDALTSASSELEDRERAAEAAAAEQRDAIRRWQLLCWHVEQVKRMVPVLKLREQLTEAEAAAITLGSSITPTGMHAQWRHREIDAGLQPVVDLPWVAEVGGGGYTVEHGRVMGGSRADDGGLTVAEWEAWGKKLAPLVKAAREEIDGDPGDPLATGGPA